MPSDHFSPSTPRTNTPAEHAHRRADTESDTLKQTAEFCFSKDVPPPALGLKGAPADWGPLYVGAPHAKAFLNRFPEQLTVPVAVIDGAGSALPIRGLKPDKLQSLGELDSDRHETHGIAVSNLIAGLGPLSGSERARIVVFSDRDEANKKLLTSRVRLANVSLKNLQPSMAGESEEVHFIFSGGNDFPEPIERFKQRQHELGATLVGNITFNGLVANHSTEGPQIDILAPGDGVITSSGMFEQFSGTSASAPAVTAALANAMAILPRLPPQQIRLLLKGSATPLVWSETGLQGAGLLNSYKMVRVADRIRNLSEIERENALKQQSTFDFSWEADEEYKEGYKLLSELESPSAEKACVAFNRALSHLWKAFLLSGKTSPRSTEVFSKTQRALESIYSHGPFFETRNFFRSLKPEGIFEVLRDELERGDADLAYTVIRGYQMAPPGSSSLLPKLTRIPQSNLQLFSALFRRSNLDEAELDALVGTMERRGGIPRMRNEIRTDSFTQPKWFPKLVQRMSENNSEGIRSEAVYLTNLLPEADALSLMTKLVDDPSPDVTESLAAMGHYQGKQALPLYEKLLRKENPPVFTLSEKLPLLGADGAPLLIEALDRCFSKNPDSFFDSIVPKTNQVLGLARFPEKVSPHSDRLRTLLDKLITEGHRRREEEQLSKDSSLGKTLVELQTFRDQLP
jgi:hypothetical protein